MRGRQIGSVRNRSKTPLAMSVLTATPVYIVIITTLITRMPGSRNWMYSCVEPASAPPKRYVYIRTSMIGKAVTSKSCSGTCLIFSMARQPKVSEAESALGLGGRSRPTRRADRRSASGAASATSSSSVLVVVVLMPPPPSCP